MTSPRFTNRLANEASPYLRQHGHNPVTGAAAFVALRQDGEIAALGYGAMSDGLVCLESVMTVERYRGRGLAYRAMSALMHWGRLRGATAVCLQVEDTNERAKRLYYRLGLTHELYRYDYRREPGAAHYTPPWMGKR